MQSTIKSVRPFASTRVPKVAYKCVSHRVRAVPQREPVSPSECSTSGSDNIWWRALASADVQKAQPVAAAALLALGMAATAGDASALDLSDAHTHAQPLAELAEQEFWGNMARYGRYFVTVMLGTGYVMLRPLQSMLKRPVTAVFAILALAGLVFGTRIALELMLGISEYDYNPDNFRIVSDIDGRAL